MVLAKRFLEPYAKAILQSPIPHLYRCLFFSSLSQSLLIPKLLRRKEDILFASQTGTGKTLTYLLPLIQFLRDDELANIEIREKRPRAMIIVPNRELVTQVLGVAKSLSHYARFRTRGISGGSKQRAQKEALELTDLLVATPGRLLLHRKNGNVFFTDIRHLVIDEADTMLDKGFAEDLKEILAPIRGRRPGVKNFHAPTQITLAAATLPSELHKKLEEFIPNVNRIIAPSTHLPTASVKQRFVPVSQGAKREALIEALKSSKAKQQIVFCNTIPSCNSTEHFLREEGFATTCYHGDILPKEREANWRMFLSGEVNVLVCTDIAARGLDTIMVDHVILFDFPRTAVDYLHRIGRTGRAGKQGQVTALVGPKEKPFADLIQVRYFLIAFVFQLMTCL